MPSNAVFTDTNTTYSAGTGISLSGTTFSNSGVRSISTGTSNGTISVNTNGTTANVAVKGLGSAAYTASTAYAASSHSHNFNQITDAPNVYLNAGTVTRRVLIQNTKNSQGYISRATIGLTNAANQFSPVFIGVGTNDGGTTFTDYYFSVGGSISDSKGNTYLSTSNWSTYCAAKSHTHSYAASSHTHNYAGSSSAGGAATSANKLNTNAGDAYKPVYFTNGIPTACTYGFNGGYGMPVVLAAGYIYKSSYTSTTWTFSGSYCPALTGGITTSVSGGVLAVTWTAASGRSRYIYGAVANMRTSGAVTSYSGTEYVDRSLGMYWLGTATNSTTTYIRAMSQGNENNDTGLSYDEMWGTSSQQSDHCILSFSIIVIGYWT